MSGHESGSGVIDFSVVVSCYFEEKSIGEFHERLSRTLASTGRSCEIIYVNDGSTDGTFGRLKEICDVDPKVAAVIDLFRNVGQPNAVTAGIAFARGRAIILIDSDLQLDPEELPRLMEEYDRGYDIVSGYRRERRDPLARKIPSLLANFVMRRASRSSLRDFGCTFKIFDGRLVRAFDFGPFRPWRPVPVIAMAGKISEVPVTHNARRHGTSGWTFRKLFAYNMESIVNLSETPFQLLGLACLLFSFLFLLRLATMKIFTFSILPKVTTGLLLNAVVIGLLITVAILCAIGEFVIRNFSLLQRKPAYVVRTMHSRVPPGA